MLSKINVNEYKTDTAKHYIKIINQLVEDMTDSTSKKALAGEYFCGNKASDYAIENGYLDYGTLAKSFDAVLCNNITQTEDFINAEMVNCGALEWWHDATNRMYDVVNDITEDISRGEYDDLDEIDDVLRVAEEYEGYIEEMHPTNGEIFQYFIISDSGAEILRDWTGELVWYLSELDVYVWGVTHWGTSWDYVLTDVKLNQGYGE